MRFLMGAVAMLVGAALVVAGGRVTWDAVDDEANVYQDGVLCEECGRAVWPDVACVPVVLSCGCSGYICERCLVGAGPPPELPCYACAAGIEVEP